MGYFEQLTEEILFKIFDDDCITAEDLISLKNVCSRFYYICNYEKLWKPRFQSRYPWAWKKISSESFKSFCLEINGNELEAAVTISKKIEEIFNSISRQLYKFKTITIPILSSIFELLNTGSFGYLIVFNELFGILNDKSNTDLTKQYYAEHLLYHVRHYLCSKEFKKFFELPPERQSYEKGAYYFSNVFYPNASLDTEYKEISSELDKLAMKIQSSLRSINPNHPAVHIELFSPDEPLESTKWSYRECMEIFDLVNCIVHRSRRLFRGGFFMYFGIIEDFIQDQKKCLKEIDHVLLNKVIESKKGNDITLSILYIAICHRLGIPLHLTTQNNRYILRWKPPNYENYKYINLLSERHFEEVELSAMACVPDYCAKTVLSHLAADSFHIAMKCSKDFISDLDMMAAVGLILLFESLSEDDNENFFDDVFAYCLKQQVHLETVIAICEKLLKKYTQLKIESISTYAKELLVYQQKDPQLIRPRRRESTRVKFAVGMIMKSSLLYEPSVIIGWDMNYDSLNPSSFKSIPHSLHNLKSQSQPFYKVLSSDGSRYYVEEERLSLANDLTPINHCEVGKYFRLFNGVFYIPNEELRQEYPDDEKFRYKFLKDYAKLQDQE